MNCKNIEVIATVHLIPVIDYIDRKFTHYFKIITDILSMDVAATSSDIQPLI